MTSRSYPYVLFRLGRRAGRAAEAGTIRYVALALAAFAMCLSAVAVAAIDITYSARLEREIARAPVTHLAESGRQPVALWGAGFDTVDDRQYSVVFVEPLIDSAPLPPGLAAWPKPGQAILSPGLTEAGKQEGIATRFGTMAGTIGPAGLSAPDERLAYVRPPRGLVPRSIMQQIEGFGSPSQPPLGDGLFVLPASMFLSAVTVLMIVPALVFLLVAARTGAKGRDQRFALLATLGGGRTARAWMSLGDALMPALVGSLGGMAVAGLITITDLRVPFVNYALAAGDMKQSLGLLIISCLIAGLVTVLVAVASDWAQPRRGRGVRPTGQRRPPVRIAALAPFMVLLATRGPDFFEPGTPLHMLVNYAGVIGTLLTLPAVVGLGAAVLGKWLVAVARLRRLGGTLLAGRWMAGHPATVARTTAGIIAAICLLVQTQVWTTFLSSEVRTARAAIAVAGDGIQLAKVKADVSAAQLNAFYRSIADTALPLLLVNSPSARELRITGSCAVLERVDLDCAAANRIDERVRQSRMRLLIDIADTPGYSVVSSVGDPARAAVARDAFTLTVLVAAKGAALDRPAVEAAAYRTLPGGADVSKVGGDWLIGANVPADHARWVVLLGMFGLVVLALTCALGALAEFVRWSRILAPVSVLSGSRRVFWSCAAWSVSVPVLLAGAVAIPMAVLLAVPQTSGGHSSVSRPLLWACVSGVWLTGIAIFAWALRSSRDIGRRWLPRGD
jgi:hypothetical protein